MGIAIPQVITEDRASGAQFIDGCLRFDKSKSQYLTRTPGSAGNRKKSTISYWIKRTIPVANFSPTAASVFGVEGGSSWFDFSFYTSDQIQFIIDAGSSDTGMRTSALLRDFSNWYHVCGVVDTDRTNDDGANGRMRIWINGKEADQTATSAGQPAAGTFTFLNDSSRAHHIGRDGRTSSIRYGDNYLAQFYLVDGLVLGPDHFGYYDPLTNVWRPKKFTADGTTINDGRSWSGTSSVSNNNGNGNGAGSLAAVFNGTMTANSSNAYGFTTGAMDFTWTPNTPISFGSQVRVWTGFSGGTIYLNGDKEVVTTNNNAWTTIVNGKSGSIESIRFVGGSGGGWWAGVEVDGVVLVNSTTQNLDFGTNGCYLPLDGNSPIGQDQSGKGNNWKPVNFGGSTDIIKATGAKPILNTLGGTIARAGVFGSEAGAHYATTSASNSGGKYVFEGLGTQPTFNFVRGATYTFDWSASSGHPLRFATAADAAGSTEYTDGTNVSGNVTKITVPHNAPDTLYYYCNVHNGMGNSISVTTDETKADPHAWKCILAMPMISGNDVSGDMNCTTTNDAITNNSVAFNNDQSIFYNRSADPDGSQYFSGVDLSSWATDSPWTVEFWWYRTGANTNNHGHFFGGTIGGTNQYGPTYRDGSHNDWQFNFKGQSIVITPSPALQTGKWEHHAFTSDGNNITYFRDGVFQTTAGASSMSGSWGSSNEIFRGGAGWSSQYVVGHVCDLRVYAGVEKYTTAGFIPASTSPDILSDTPSGVGVKTQLAKFTDGAVDFTGSSQYLKTNASSTDFTFGTGDFTVEMMLYNRETAGKGFIQISDTAGGLKNTSSGVITIHKDGSSQVFRAYVKNGSTAFSTVVPYKKWCHVALVRESGTIKLFVDGKQDATTVTGDTTNYATTYVAIGGYYDTSYLSNCTISNVRINKGTAVYTKDFTPPTAPLTNITNTKLLCCQSNTSTLDAAVTPSGVSIAENWMPSGYTYWDAGFTAGFSYAGSRLSTPTRSDFIPVALPSSGKYYWEIRVKNVGTYHVFGITNDGGNRPGNDGYQDHISGFYYNGNPPIFLAKKASGTSTADQITHGAATGTTFSNGDILMWAYDADAAKMWIGRNGTWYASGDPSAGTNAGFQNMPTSGAFFKTSYSTTGSGTMTFEILSKSSGPQANTLNPFNTDIDTVRGQEGIYATLNPLIKGSQVTLSDGNLRVSVAGGTGRIFYSTLGASSGKWYAEYTAISAGSTNMIGVSRPYNPTGNYLGVNSNYGYGYYGSGTKYNGTGLTYGASYTTGDTIGIALDLDARTLTFYKNGVSQGVAFTRLPDDYYYFAGGEGSMQGTMNFGQKPFKFPPPDGFQPLTSSTARPDTVISSPDQFMNVMPYSGTNNSGNIDVTSADTNFTPDFVWVKTRTGGNENNAAYDSVRGANKRILPSSTAGEVTTSSNDLNAFIPGGFTMNGQNGHIYNNGYTHVAWMWKAGGKDGSNAFNIDDVGYASASDVNMGVGDLNSVAYNSSKTWSNGINAISNPTNAFDGNTGTYAQNPNNTMVSQIVLRDIGGLSGRVRVWVGTSGGNRYMISLNDGTTVTTGTSYGGGWVNVGVSLNIHSITVTRINGSNTEPANECMVYAYEIDGKMLLNPGVSAPVNIPTIATTGCSVGTKQGFSIIKYAYSSGSDAKIAHGLTQKPEFMLNKALGGTTNWNAYHADAYGAGGGAETGRFTLNNANSYTNEGDVWYNTPPTDTHFTIGPASWHGTGDHIMYLWHSVPGFSKFGKYIANNSADGPYIELGFRPALVVCKSITQGQPWQVYDQGRSPINPANRGLQWDSTGQEYNSTDRIDILSSGFKIRAGGGTEPNVGTNAYIYAAWAEAPAFNLYGAPSNAR